MDELIVLIDCNKLYEFYNSRYWRRLSHEVIKEQNNECQLCKARGRYTRATIAHHVNHLRERPDLAYSRLYIDENGKKQRNLLALCHACHEKEHGRVFKGNTRERKGFTNEEKF